MVRVHVDCLLFMVDLLFTGIGCRNASARARLFRNIKLGID
jgi:hypothetical protein